MERCDEDGGECEPTIYLQDFLEFASNPMDQDSKREHLKKEKSKEKVSEASIKRNGNWGDSSKLQVEGNSLMKDDGGSTTWSAVVMQALQTRDEMKISEKEIRRLQQVMNDTVVFLANY